MYLLVSDQRLSLSGTNQLVLRENGSSFNRINVFPYWEPINDSVQKVLLFHLTQISLLPIRKLQNYQTQLDIS